jgi:SulP family sulfate permease
MITQTQRAPKLELVLNSLTYVPFYLLRPVRVFRHWSLTNFAPDLIAGITVGLVALPQAIAFALIADLPPEMGLYATIVASIVGALWGSTDQIQTGPANAISILVYSALLGIAEPGTSTYILAAGMIAVMAGVFQLFVGLTRLGVLVNFVSHSVVVGFASGAAVLIAVGQAKHLLGLQFDSQTLLETVYKIFVSLPAIHWPTALLGLGVIGFLLLLGKFAPRLPGPLLVMVLASGVVFSLGLENAGVAVIGELPRGLPPFTPLPLFDFAFIAKLSSASLAVAAISLIQTTAIARAIASETGQRIDNNQEFVGQGMANIAAGFFSGYPGAASFARSAVSLKAGAKTAAAAIFSGLFVLLAVLVLAPLTAYLPRTALAGVLIIIAYGLVDRQQILRIWRGAFGDAAIMVVTFLGTLFLPLEFAVIAGILLSFAIYALKTSLPRVFSVVSDEEFKHFVEQQPGQPGCPQLGIIKISGDLYFGAVSHVEDSLLEHLAKHPEQRFLLLRMHGVNNCDIDGIFMLENLRAACLERGGDLFFMKLQQPVLQMMTSTGFCEKLGETHFLDDEVAIDYLFHRVLDPAICIYECQARAFYECQNLPKRTYSPDTGQQYEELVDVPKVTPQELWRELEAPAAEQPIVIDVRESSEYKSGHIPQIQHRPLRVVLDAPETVPVTGQVVFVCRGGRRSRQAVLVLKNLGNHNVRMMQGGMLAWKTAGLPTDKELLVINED